MLPADITRGEVPEWLPDYRLGGSASWEVDIWKKLRNSLSRRRLTTTSPLLRGQKCCGDEHWWPRSLMLIMNCWLDNQLNIMRSKPSNCNKMHAGWCGYKAGCNMAQNSRWKIWSQYWVRKTWNMIFCKNKKKGKCINLMLGRYNPFKNQTAFLHRNLQVSRYPVTVVHKMTRYQAGRTGTGGFKTGCGRGKTEFTRSSVFRADWDSRLSTYRMKFPESMLFSLAGRCARVAH